jgi:hypothetical protein
MAKRKAAQPANAGAEAIMPLTDFRGDPWKTGDKNAVAFRAGILSSPVPAEFAQQMRDEGKAAKRGIPAIGDSVTRNAGLGREGDPEAIPAADTAADQPGAGVD